MESLSPTRMVHCADATAWLRSVSPPSDWAFVTSLPDVSEMGGLSLDAWRAWFIEAAAQLLDACAPDTVVLFYQTDIKKHGVWIDKGYLCQKAAEACGSALLWHKQVCRKPPGTITFGRPAYSHLLCFSKALRPSRPPSIPDILPDMGPSIWARGMGAEACLLACKYILEWTPSRTVVDAYCGKGTVLAAANHLGLHAIGVELSGKRARQARGLGWPPGRGPRLGPPEDSSDD